MMVCRLIQSYVIRLTGVALLLAMTIQGCFCSSQLRGGLEKASEPVFAFETFQKASFVIGAPDLVSFGSGLIDGHSIDYPFTVFVSNGKVYVPDSSVSRVLVYDQIPNSNDLEAAYALGQAPGASNLTASFAGSAAADLLSPSSVAEHDGALLILDESNRKLMIWDQAPAPGDPADRVLGHSSVAGIGAGGCDDFEFMSAQSVFVTRSGRVILADSLHNRIMIWNSLARVTTGDGADLILGDAGCNPGTTGTTFSWPNSVWSDDQKLIVVDNGNQRVLIWSEFPADATTPPDLVLGQSDLTTSNSGAALDQLDTPIAVASDGTLVAVSEYGNNRILIWNQFPTRNGQPADVILGQSTENMFAPNDEDQDGHDDALPSARTFYGPGGIYLYRNRLYVTDRTNHRVLIFRKIRQE